MLISILVLSTVLWASQRISSLCCLPWAAFQVGLHNGKKCATTNSQLHAQDRFTLGQLNGLSCFMTKGLKANYDSRTFSPFIEF